LMWSSEIYGETGKKDKERRKRTGRGRDGRNRHENKLAGTDTKGITPNLRNERKKEANRKKENQKAPRGVGGGGVNYTGSKKKKTICGGELREDKATWVRKGQKRAKEKIAKDSWGTQAHVFRNETRGDPKKRRGCEAVKKKKKRSKGVGQAEKLGSRRKGAIN